MTQQDNELINWGKSKLKVCPVQNTPLRKMKSEPLTKESICKAYS